MSDFRSRLTDNGRAILEASAMLKKPFAIRVKQSKAQVVSVIVTDDRTGGVTETPQCAWMSGKDVLDYVKTHGWLR